MIGWACRGSFGRGAAPGHPPGAAVHAVRDFIHVMIGHWPWPTFNLADSSLVCGAGLLIWHAFVTRDEGRGAGADGRGARTEEMTKPD